MSREWPIVIRFVVTEEDRRQVASHYGDSGMASLADCRKFLENSAYGDLAEAGMHDAEDDYDAVRRRMKGLP